MARDVKVRHTMATKTKVAASWWKRTGTVKRQRYIGLDGKPLKGEATLDRIEALLAR